MRSTARVAVAAAIVVAAASGCHPAGVHRVTMTRPPITHCSTAITAFDELKPIERIPFEALGTNRAAPSQLGHIAYLLHGASIDATPVALHVRLDRAAVHANRARLALLAAVAPVRRAAAQLHLLDIQKRKILALCGQ